MVWRAGLCCRLNLQDRPLSRLGQPCRVRTGGWGAGRLEPVRFFRGCFSGRVSLWAVTSRPARWVRGADGHQPSVREPSGLGPRQACHMDMRSPCGAHGAQRRVGAAAATGRERGAWRLSPDSGSWGREGGGPVLCACLLRRRWAVGSEDRFSVLTWSLTLNRGWKIHLGRQEQSRSKPPAPGSHGFAVAFQTFPAHEALEGQPVLAGGAAVDCSFGGC